MYLIIKRMELTVHIGLDELVQAISNLPANQRQHLRTLLDADAATNEFTQNQVRTFGTMPGLITYMADDFDAPLADFDEYM